MERPTLSRRRALAHAAATLAVAAAIPATALADKPAEQRNGPPGPAGNPNHGQAPAQPGNGNGNAYGHAQQPASPPRRPAGRPVRAHGNPPARPQPAPAPARPARPAPQQRTDAPAADNGAAHQKTTLCHATGSAANPYVEITISDRAVDAHARHQDGRDIIPAPAGGCPATAPAQAPAAEQLAAPVAEEVAAVIEERREATTGRKGESAVAGVTETSSPAGDSDSEPTAAAAATANEATATDDDGTLPFTGLELVLVIMIGAAFLLAGFALRRSRTTS